MIITREPNKLLEIAIAALQAESVRRAALAVVQEWEAGILITKHGYGCNGLSVSVLRDALAGFVSDDVLREVQLDDDCDADNIGDET